MQRAGLACKHGRQYVGAILVTMPPAVDAQLAQIGATVGRSYALRRQPKSLPAD